MFRWLKRRLWDGHVVRRAKDQIARLDRMMVEHAKAMEAYKTRGKDDPWGGGR